MYKVIIIDDEKAAIETLRRDLEVQADLEIKGTAGNGAKGEETYYGYTSRSFVPGHRVARYSGNPFA